LMDMLRILIIDSTKKDQKYLKKCIDDKKSNNALSFEVIAETEMDKRMTKHTFDLLIHGLAMRPMHSNLEIKDLYPETSLFVLQVFSYHKQGREEEDKHMMRDIIPKILQRQIRSA